MLRFGNQWSRAFAIAAVVTAFGGFFGSANAQQVVISESFRFTSDITCTTNPCVVISGSRIRVDGRGFTIHCNDNIGVQIIGDKVTLLNLNLSGCSYGVAVQSVAEGTIVRSINAVNYSIAGFAIAGPKTQISSCDATSGNPTDSVGIIVNASSASVINNFVTNNTYGISFLAGTTSGKATGNDASDNTIAGIVVDAGATGHEISRNTALDNGGDYDLIDQNAACDSNRWSRNTFGTANQICIQ